MASWHQSTGQAEQQEMMKLQAEMLKMQQWETMKVRPQECSSSSLILLPCVSQVVRVQANIEELHMISTRCERVQELVLIEYI
eukprot:SAG31_NODE_342_length_17455_cov_6.381251_2_plen_83_part_00